MPPSFGDFDVIRRIGGGGMGVVFEARQRALARKVALKVLSPGLASDETSWRRFEREARAAGSLHHPNIVPVYELGVEAGVPYYAMEYIEGETLQEIQDRIRRPGGSVDRPRDPLRRIQDDTIADLWRRIPGMSSGRGADEGIASRSPPHAVLSEGESADAPGVGAAGAGPFEAGSSRLGPEADGAGALEAAALPPEGGPPAPSVPDSIFGVPADSGLTSSGSRSRRTLFFRWLALAMSEVAGALHHAHGSRIVHRDLKPSNLILDAQGKLRILDFGLAWTEGGDELTRSNERVGTIRYMSPEQARGDAAGREPGTDIWGLGITIYSILAGRAACSTTGGREVLADIARAEPKPLRSLNPHVPRDLETIVMKCLARNPRDRFLTAEALAQELRRFADGRPIETRPVHALVRWGRRAWRSRARILQAGALLVVALAAGLVIVGRIRDGREVARREYGALCCVAWARLHAPLRPVAGLGRVDPTVCLAGGPAPTIAFDGLTLENRTRAVLRFAASGAFCADAEPHPAWSALDTLDRAAGRWPARGDPTADLYRTVALLALERDDEAARTLAATKRRGGALQKVRAVELLIRGTAAPADASGSGPTRGGDAWCEAWAAGLAAARSGDWDRADERLDEVLRDATEEERREPWGIGNHVVQAMARLEGGKFPEAIANLVLARERWGSLDGDPVEPEILRGEACCAAGDRRAASSCFVKLYQRIPAADRSRRSDVALRIAAIYRDARMWGDAISWTRSVDPPTVLSLRLRAEVQLLVGDREAARASAMEALASPGGKTDLATHLILGNVQAALGDARAAVDVWDEAARLAPDDPRCLVAVGLGFVCLGDPLKAEEAFARAAAAAPWYYLASFHLARIHEAMQKDDLAEREYADVLRRNPKHAPTHNALGLLHARRHKLSEAMRDFSRAILADAGLAPPHYNLGLCYQQAFRYEDAAREYRQALALGLDHPILRINLGAVLHSNAKYSEAASHFAAVPQGDPLHALAMLNRAKAVWKSGSLEEAFPIFEKAVAEDPGSADALTALAHAHEYGESPGDFKRTFESYRQAVRLAPRYGPALRGLAGCLWGDAGKRISADDLEDAIRLLDDGVHAPGAVPSLTNVLEEHRALRLPRIESFASADWCLDRPEVLLAGDAEWRLFRGRRDPAAGLAWTERGFDDREWELGRGAFGYGAQTSHPIGTLLRDMERGYTSVYLRRELALPRLDQYARLQLDIEVDDGCVVYVNGREVYRTNAGDSGAELHAVSCAARSTEPTPVRVELDPASFVPERNSIAIHGLNGSLESSDFLLHATLGAERRPSLEADRAAVASLSPASPGIGAYLEGRVLQRSGRAADALAAFETAAAAAPPRAEPALRIAECLVAIGRAEEAAERLAGAIRGGLAPEEILWDAWARTVLVDLGRSRSEALAIFPVPAGSRQGPADDLRWALDRMDRDGAIRIDCGGGDYVGNDGRSWSRDRFYRGGLGYVGYLPAPSEIAKTDDDPLYQTERICPSWCSGPVAYRVPLSPGTYGVTLHFAETWHTDPGQRVFDVVVEGEAIAESLDPIATSGGKGVAFALPERVVRVSDASLEIGFRERREAPKISAIEIVRR